MQYGERRRTSWWQLAFLAFVAIGVPAGVSIATERECNAQGEVPPAEDSLDAATESKLKKALRKKWTVDFITTPLSQAIARISKEAGVKIVLNESGLAAEGVTRATPVTLNLEQPISIQSTLELILSPLHLRYYYHGKVIEITDEATVSQQLRTITFNVADLVSPAVDRVRLDAKVAVAQGASAATRRAHFEFLIQRIKAIDPSTWDDAGGRGSITACEPNLTLIVRQSQPGQEAVADILEQLRRRRDLQVALTLETVRVPNQTFHDKLKNLSEVELIKQLRSDNNVQIEMLPHVMVDQDKVIEIPIQVFRPEVPHSASLQIVPTVAPDRRTVQLKYAIDASNSLPVVQTARSAAGFDGAPLVFDVTGGLVAAGSQLRSDAERVLIIATPQIIPKPQEEERPIGRSLHSLHGVFRAQEP